MFGRSGSGRRPVAVSGAWILRERNRSAPRLTEYSAAIEYFRQSSCSMPALACDAYGDRMPGATRTTLGGGDTASPPEYGSGKEGLEMTTWRSRRPSKRSDRSAADWGRLS